MDCPTGFGTQHRLVAEALSSQWPGLVSLGLHDEEPVRPLWGGRAVAVPVYSPGENAVDVTLPRWWPLLKRWARADMLITLGDWRMFDCIAADPERPRPWLHWIPADSPNYPEQRHTQICSVDWLVFMSEFGEGVYAPRIQGRMRTANIPHGIDTATFKPVPGEEKNRLRGLWEFKLAELNGRPCKLRGKQVLVCHDTHQWRKQTWRLIEMMRHLPKDCVLCLHCSPGPRPGSDGWHLDADVKRLGLEEQVFFTGRKVRMENGERVYARPKIDAPYLATFLQMADLRVSATAGEGFGIGTIEAMACGVPTVITDCTTSREVLGLAPRGATGEGEATCGAVVEPAAVWRKPGEERTFSLVGPADMADAVRCLSVDEGRRSEMAAAGVARVGELYTVERVGGMWIDLVGKVLADTSHL